MKLALAALAYTSLLLSQEAKTLVVPLANTRGLTVTAQEILRETPYPATIHAKGNVEIRSPFCVRTYPGNALTCEGYLVIHADQADIHEATGQIDPQGHVTITRQR